MLHGASKCCAGRNLRARFCVRTRGRSGCSSLGQFLAPRYFVTMIEYWDA